MKKFFAAVALCASMTAASAQTQYGLSESKLFWDNWYASLSVGGQTPLTGNMIDNARFNWGVEIGRFLTPVFGLGAEYRLAVNTTPSYNAFDQSNLSGLMKFNLSNLFCGYKGEPRFFEVVANFGFGWGHNFVTGWEYNYTQVYEKTSLGQDKMQYKEQDASSEGWDMNYLTSKAGLEFNFNLGEKKAWMINIKPAVVWAMHENFYSESSDHDLVYNANQAALEITAGATYKFGNSNGTHNFTRSRLYDQNEIDALNGQINALRGQVADKDAQLASANGRIAKDAKRIKELEESLANVRPCEATGLETIVSFACASSTIAETQVVNVERVAQYLKANNDARVNIKGYASPEGGRAYNERLATRRANAVKNMLIKKYGIDESRITAEGAGVGNIFNSPKLNRVAINIVK